MNKSALLVMDYQEEIVGRHAEGAATAARLAPVIQAARAKGVPVIYVTITFRDGYPEVSPRNKSFSTFVQMHKSGGPSRLLAGKPESAIHKPVAPQAGEVQVQKKRVSAFAGSDLAMVLRARDIDTLVLAGIATSGVVLSTLRQAADLDYSLVVLADCCADNDPEVHRVLTEKVFPRQAEVMRGSDWAARLD